MIFFIVLGVTVFVAAAVLIGQLATGSLVEPPAWEGRKRWGR